MGRFFNFEKVENDIVVDLFWVSVGTLGTLAGLVLVALGSM